MSFFRPNYYRPATGNRLTGFPRYLEILELNIKHFLLVNLLTLIGFLPFIAGVALSILSSSVLLLIPSCLIGGIFAGPALSGMYDLIMRSLRDASKDWWNNYKLAWKQNWRSSLLPGIIFCLMLGFYIFMSMLFWWSVRFPGWGSLAIFFCSLFVFTMFFSICWPQIVLFNQPFRQNLKNCLLFMLRFLPKTAGIALLQIVFWALMVLFLPWSIFLIPLLGIWFILFTANFLIYDTFNKAFEVEKKIAEAFPEQVPFYENDEAWVKRKQEEINRNEHTNS